MWSLSLSVVDEEGLSDVVDAVAIEGTTRRAVGDVADIIQVVGAATTVAFDVAADRLLQHKGLGDVVVLVAVGTGAVVADDTCLALSHFGNGEATHDEAVQAEHITVVAAAGSNVDAICLACGIGEDEPLSVACDGAVFTHTLASGEEDWSLLDVFDSQPSHHVGELVVHLLAFAGEEQENGPHQTLAHRR